MGLLVQAKRTVHILGTRAQQHGNEMADELARKGSATALLGPEPYTK